MKSVTVYIPTNMPKSQLWIDALEHYMSKQFGGVTITHGQGAWLNAYQVVVHDDIALLQSYERQPGQIEKRLAGLRDILDCAKIALEQETIMVTVQDGEMSLL